MKNLYDVPLCTYILDDQNIYGARIIPDEPLKELIQKSDLCLGISPELCTAYQNKFDRAFWWLPPVVEPSSIVDSSVAIEPENLDRERGILIGNIWSQKWLDRLQKLTRETGYQIDWYGQPNRRWLIFNEEEMLRDGLILKEYLPESRLAPILQQFPYTIIPTATTEDPAERPEIARLSIPSRPIFTIASSNTPTIVIGRRDSAVARFVESFQIGFVCDYDPDSFREVVSKICSPPVQAETRSRAVRLAKNFSSEGIGEWIWRSLSAGKPIDDRFEKLRGVSIDR